MMENEMRSEESPPSPTALNDTEAKVYAAEPIESPAGNTDEATLLAALGADTRDQDDLERDIGRQADAMLTEQADERDNKRLEKTTTDKARLEGQVKRLERKLQEFGNKTTKDRFRAEIAHYQVQIRDLDTDLEQIQRRIDERHNDGAQGDETLLGNESNQRQAGESQREFLIRTGKITPFSKMGLANMRTSSSLAEIMLDAEQEDGEADDDAQQEAVPVTRSHRNLLKPGFADDTTDDDQKAINEALEEFANERPTKRRRIQTRGEAQQIQSKKRVKTEDDSDAESADDYIPDMDEEGIAAIGESADEDEPEDEDVEGDFPLDTPGIKKQGRKGKQRAKVGVSAADDQEDLAGIDDGNEGVYQSRLQSWIERRGAARHAKQAQQETKAEDEDDEEWHLPHPTRPDTEFEGGFRIPGDIYPSLFDYQKTGVQWLWELYSQQVGGIVGDEMGLGKTVQIISFLAGLHYSNKLTKPIIVVCPATVMKQWVNEFHRWWPPLRVSILHTSGSGMLDIKREGRIEDDLEMSDYGRTKTRMTKGEKAAKRIVDMVSKKGHVLVTTYSGLQTYADLLIPTDWEYAVLDEGHKIRNPNTAITIYCKEIRTHNSIILSGTPMQNNLSELWSLFDFVFPMRLGTLVNFRQQFEFPIKQGGYANASNLQVETAMKCAETLKDTISPYLLQRFKVDVASDLPKKSERVLFCKLTKLQRENYEFFLGSEDMKSILNGKRHALFGVDILRKICNHPDLVQHKTLSIKPDYDYGDPIKSGKMQVVKALLEIWKKNGHKTLLFAQHRIMLDILQKFISSLGGFNFRRMDGNTSIKDRQDLVDEFNRDPDLHVFLLTTKVGGLGVNLTGADRVIIYDPDWNPSTDVQARERAWRLGQKREVEIYRLMTAGTIEEKIYHRQIFKQFLTNKILRDPKQRQSFQLRDLHDLFTLGDANDGETETGSIFKGTEVKLTRGDSTSTSVPAPTTQTSTAEIKGISHQTDFEDPSDPNASTPSDANKPNNDDRVLSSIFARTGVQSALSHDDIINGKRVIRADPSIIAREARKVASAAAEELRRAGEEARHVPIGTPTWTGTYGSAGRPETPSSSRGGRGSGRSGSSSSRGGRGGLSSASVLANLAARQQGSSSATASSSSQASTPTHQPKGREFLALIRDYLVAHGGKAYTQMLIDHFNRYCGTPQRTAEFREMLKTIAVLDKGRGGRGRWELREEFKAASGN